MLPAFVIRCDTTPDIEPFRVTRPGYCVDRNGDGPPPAHDGERELALEPRPELQWEAFDEYWRKVHGPKITFVDGDDDSGTNRLLRYEQQHRVPAGPTSAFSPPYRARTTTEQRLPTDPYKDVPAYQRPSFDGLAQLTFRSRAGLDAFFGVQPGDKYIDKIVPDERVFLKGFAFNISEEHVVVPDVGLRDPIVMVKTVERKRHALSRARFQARWLRDRAAIVASGSKQARLIGRYAQLHNISKPSDGAFFDPVGNRIDVVEVFSFPSMTALELFLSSAEYSRMQRVDDKWTARTEFFTAVNFEVKPFAAEGPTS